MTVRRTQAEDGVIVDGLGTEGAQAMVTVVDGRAGLTVLPARGCFHAGINLDREAAVALAEELLKVRDA